MDINYAEGVAAAAGGGQDEEQVILRKVVNNKKEVKSPTEYFEVEPEGVLSPELAAPGRLNNG